MLLEVAQVLVHTVRLVSPDEAADGGRPEQNRRIEDAEHEGVLLAANQRVVVEHVVEVPHVGEREPGGLKRALHSTRP